jgi:hypothetical protein
MKYSINNQPVEEAAIESGEKSWLARLCAVIGGYSAHKTHTITQSSHTVTTITTTAALPSLELGLLLESLDLGRPENPKNVLRYPFLPSFAPGVFAPDASPCWALAEDDCVDMTLEPLHVRVAEMYGVPAALASSGTANLEISARLGSVCSFTMGVM